MKKIYANISGLDFIKIDIEFGKKIILEFSDKPISYLNCKFDHSGIPNAIFVSFDNSWEIFTDSYGHYLKRFLDNYDDDGEVRYYLNQLVNQNTFCIRKNGYDTQWENLTQAEAKSKLYDIACEYNRNYHGSVEQNLEDIGKNLNEFSCKSDNGISYIYKIYEMFLALIKFHWL